MKNDKLLITQVFDKKIENCEDVQEFQEILMENRAKFESWEAYIYPFWERSGYSKKQIAFWCGVDEKTGRSFLKQIPKKRENVISLGIIFGMNQDEIDYMLMHKAKFHRLYAKNSEDAIWIYMIEHKIWTPEQTVKEIYIQKYERYKELYRMYVEPEYIQKELNTKVVLSNLQHEKDFDKAMQRVIPTIATGYEKLIRYMDEYMVKREMSVSDFDFQNQKDNVSQIYYRELRKIKKDKTIPSRLFLISLGLHLNMTVDELNLLLEYAGMMPLYSKDVIECRVLYYLESLYISYPSFFSISSEVNELQDEEEYNQADDLVQYIYERLKEEQVTGEDDKALEKILKLL